MKSSLVRIAIAALAIGTLTACGSASPTGPSAGSGTPGAGFPRTVEHAMGTTTIPAQPQRIVALDDSYVEQALMLETQVVGYTDYRTEGGGLAEHLGASRSFGAGAVSVGPLTAPSVERVATLDPDVIVSAKVRHEKQYSQLSAIAPTVMSETTGQTWRENIALLAKSLGKESLAAERLTQYEAEAAKVGRAVRAKAGEQATISVVRFVTSGPTRLYGRKSFTGMVIADARLARPAAQDVDELMVEISPEQIPMADGTRIFVATNGAKAADARGEFERNPLWASLVPKVVTVEDREWISSVSVQGAYTILADIAAAFGVEGPAIPSWISGR
ncbi:iron-siderophore ABC transporter substrate-binding protein [Tsukamurella sp. M9C]|uniref:ABC transporter substrate-binding protein n=1 Tax=unclassified Tsukamurella TaxID=2633480 RepID=UPI001CCC9BB7|nr:iron-siderophore ABC transporter substrate-binding protein [Tsukamurella sp. M9C]MCA0157821.1 iron-siderophore ABC transporter substrate-binding protein [Tsukamurella sp. M9C]